MQQQMRILRFQNIDPCLTIFCVSIKPLRNSTFLLYSVIVSGLGLLLQDKTYLIFNVLITLSKWEKKKLKFNILIISKTVFYTWLDKLMEPKYFDFPVFEKVHFFNHKRHNLKC